MRHAAGAETMLRLTRLCQYDETNFRLESLDKGAITTRARPAARMALRAIFGSIDVPTDYEGGRCGPIHVRKSSSLLSCAQICRRETTARRRRQTCLLDKAKLDSRENVRAARCD